MTTETNLIAIGGCSCSGKTTLARHLAQTLGGIVFPLDSYYRDLSQLAPEARARTNFDAPAAIESELLLRHLGELAAGRAIDRPVYDYTTHTRSPKTILVPAGGTVLLEGLFVLYWPGIRDLCSLRAFVDVDEETCLARRIARDVAERGRTEQSVRSQYEETVRPMARRYVIPTLEFADVVVPGDGPVAHAAELVFRLLDRSSCSSLSRP